MDRKSDARLSLFTPGPVSISREASHGLGRSGLHHRSDEFRRLMSDLSGHLKAAFLTTGDVVTLTSSGTGAMEAALANLLSSGDKALVAVSGKFSRRWAEICEAYGVDVTRIEIAPGKSPEPESVTSALEAAPAIGAVLLTHCETSTGSLSDLEAICDAIHDLERRRGSEILIIADCIASLCVDELRVDAWGIDCAVSASQKGLLSHPGLAFLSLGKRALERVGTTTSSRYYFDLRKYLKPCVERSRERPEYPPDTPFTPAIPLVSAVEASLAHLLDLGMESVWRANRSGASAIRLLVEAAGFKPVADRQASGVVAFWSGGVDAGRIAETLEEDHGIIIAGGQGDLEGSILRVSPIGKGPGELRRFAGAFSDVLAKMGRTLDMDAIETEFDRLLEGCSIWE